MIVAIQRMDSDGHIVLLSDWLRKKYERRLVATGANMAHIHFVNHIGQHNKHNLLALYMHADVLLDSYPATGCTTTREILELGSPIVTFPSMYLGSRWTTGFYQVMHMDELIARNKSHYAQLAVNIATNRSYREGLRQKIRVQYYRLVESDATVQSWRDAIYWMARPNSVECRSSCFQGTD